MVEQLFCKQFVVSSSLAVSFKMLLKAIEGFVKFAESITPALNKAVQAVDKGVKAVDVGVKALDKFKLSNYFGLNKKSKKSTKSKQKSYVKIIRKVSDKPKIKNARRTVKDKKPKKLSLIDLINISNKDLHWLNFQDKKITDKIAKFREDRRSRRIIDVLQLELRDKLSEIGRKVNKQEITVEEFKDEFKKLYENYATAAMIVGAGGLGNVSKEIIQKTQKNIERQNQYIDRFVDKSLASTAGINNRGMLSNPIQPKDMKRLRDYASSIKQSYELAEGQVLADGEYEVEERRKVTATESCEDCFVGETIISCENGFKKIKDINVGDKVYTHTMSLKPVYKLISKRTKTLFEINVGERKVLCTGNHPFLLKSGEWKEARNLILDDELMLFEN